MGHFCVNHGTPLSARVIEGRELEACPDCDFVLWRDPKVVTMVVVQSGGGIVLGRRGIEPGYGMWCLPGGFVNSDEHPAVAAARECREEIGAEVEIQDLLGIHHIAKPAAPGMIAIAYSGVVRDPMAIAAGPEMLEVRAFDPRELPDLAFPSHHLALRDWESIRATVEQ